MAEVYVVGGARTPQGKYGGQLSRQRPDDLAALVLAEALRRSGAPLDGVDEVILGAANQGGEDNRNVARMALLLAGFPVSTPGFTVNRLCASGLTAIASGAHAIRGGEAEVVVAGGVESMTRAPWVMAKPGTPWAKPGEVHDTSIGWRFTNPRFTASDQACRDTTGTTTLSMGETAEEVASAYGITRERSDAFAVRSHQRAIDAIDGGRPAADIVEVETDSGVVDTDEGPRRGSTIDALSRLRPAFRPNGIVTAASSSPLSDGAAAVVLASESAIERHGLIPRARIVASASAGVEPRLMGLGPVPATHKALSRVGWSVDSIGTIELNEAFAAQSLGVIDELHFDEDLVNADGGAIALGHPLGCTGARILLNAVGRMERENTTRALVTLCVGVGQGVTMLVEAL